MRDAAVDEARRKAFARAQRLCAGDRPTAGQVIHEAQMDVLRVLVSRSLPGGEAEFWALVGKEIP